jgi:hypothetical protein
MTDKTFFNDFLFYCLGLGWTVTFTNNGDDHDWYDFTKDNSEYSFRAYVETPSDYLLDMQKIKSIGFDFCGPGGFEGDMDMDHELFTPQGFILHINTKIQTREIEDKLLGSLNLN